MNLRPYQRQAIDDLWAWFATHHEGHPVVEASVGAGKSVMIAALCQEAITQWPGTRILMVVASRELCAQNLEKLRAVWPEAPAGLHSAGLGKKDLGTPILYATIGSVAKKAHLLGRVDLLLVDECHNISNRAEGMYRSLIDELLRYTPHMRVIGWTGTAFRGDGVWLTDAEAPLFTHVAARVTMRELLDQKYLAPLKAVGTDTTLHADGVGMRGGDFIVSQLASAVDKRELVEACASELVRIGANRKRWLVYGVTVEHARHITEALTDRGIKCAFVCADTPLSERDASIAAFKAGRIRALVNVAVLTTGFDVPEVDLIALLRNTRSPVLYTQIAGRGMRIADSKTDCLWVDFTDTTAELGPVDAIKGRAKRTKREGSAPHKVCEECGNPSPTSARECAECGALFPEPERINHSTTASHAAVLSGADPIVVTYEVDRVEYKPHSKPGKPDSLRVDYYNGFRLVASEWVCLDHEGYARGKACTWWQRRQPQPMSIIPGVSQAMEWIEGGYKPIAPSAITVNESGKFPEIIGYEF